MPTKINIKKPIGTAVMNSNKCEIFAEMGVVSARLEVGGKMRLIKRITSAIPHAQNNQSFVTNSLTENNI